MSEPAAENAPAVNQSIDVATVDETPKPFPLSPAPVRNPMLPSLAAELGIRYSASKEHRVIAEAKVIEALGHDHDTATIINMKVGQLAPFLRGVALAQAIDNPILHTAYQDMLQYSKTFAEARDELQKRSDTLEMNLAFKNINSPGELISLVQNAGLSYQNKYDELRAKLEVNEVMAVAIEDLAECDTEEKLIVKYTADAGWHYDAARKVFVPQ